MRPKKRILLVDADEDRLAVLRFVLRTHRFLVWGTTEVSAAREILRDEIPHVLLLAWPLEAASVEALFRVNDQQFDRSRTLLVAEGETDMPAVTVDRFLLGADCVPVNVIEAAKISAQRKRGPRKKPVISCDLCEDVEFWTDLDQRMEKRDMALVAG